MTSLRLSQRTGCFRSSLQAPLRRVPHLRAPSRLYATEDKVVVASQQPSTERSASSPNLWLQTLASGVQAAPGTSVATTALPLILLGMAALADPSWASDPSSEHVGLFDLAEGEDFWGNVARYGRYFVTVMLGTGYVMVRPLAGMFKNPLSAVLAIASIAGLGFFMKFTLEAMLGMSEPFEYVESKF